MLTNPFTPSEIASHEDFFGRVRELEILERSFGQGSVVVQGGIGIGKSSLMSRIMLEMEGYASTHKSKGFIAVADKNIETIDQAARLMLEAFVEVDETQKQLSLKLGKVLGLGSTEIFRNFQEGRHLAVLKRILEKESVEMILDGGEYLILGIDEADKCPVPLAMLIRSLSTHIQQAGVRNVRFLFTGVNPFYKRMVDEDSGIDRFFYKKLTLSSMLEEEARELIETKLKKVQLDAQTKQIELHIHPDVVDHVVVLSGGHPAVLQLLGSHLVEHENDNKDGIIDSRDLVESLRTICYQSRGHVYDSIIHTLQLENKLSLLGRLLANASSVFPTRIDRRIAEDIAEDIAKKSDIEWLIENNILTVISDQYYGLTDEFLHVRMQLDRFEEHEVDKIELAVIGDYSDFESYEGVTEYVNRIWMERFGVGEYLRDRFLDPLEDDD